jgi:hypothetical protein
MSKPVLLVIFSINLNVSILLGAYEVGDTISIADQNIEYDVCSGDYDNDQLKLSDFNGDFNGVGYMVTLLLIQATW